MIQLMARRELLRFAVQTDMTCPQCGAILDVSTSVLLEDTVRHQFALACAPCSGRAPFDGKLGCVEVYDGRVLFAKPPRKSRKARTRTPAGPRSA